LCSGNTVGLYSVGVRFGTWLEHRLFCVFFGFLRSVNTNTGGRTALATAASSTFFPVYLPFRLTRRWVSWNRPAALTLVHTACYAVVFVPEPRCASATRGRESSGRRRTAASHVRFRATVPGICGGRNATGTLLSEHTVFPCQCIAPVLHTHHPRPSKPSVTERTDGTWEPTNKGDAFSEVRQHPNRKILALQQF
jgi:hypothetical protein